MSSSVLDDLYAKLLFERYPISMEYFDNTEFYRIQYLIEKMVQYKKDYDSNINDDD